MRGRSEAQSDPLHGKLNSFRDAASKIGSPGCFETADQLATDVLAAVTRWEKAGRPGARRIFAARNDFFDLETPQQKLLRHDVMLYGRSKEVDELNAFEREDAAVLMLTAEGGAGKSKLLHDWTQTVAHRSILFVKPGALWHGEAARELPDGPILIAFDDGHQEPLLVESVALLLREVRQRRDAKLVVATRPSGADRVRAAITRRFGSEEVRSLRLSTLTLDDRRRIAEAVLRPDYVYLRDHLVEVAGESPLVLVVAGRIIAGGEVDPAALLAAPRFSEPSASSAPFLSAAIRKMAAAGLDEFRQIAKAALESAHERLFSAAAHALVGMPFDRPTAADVELLWLAALREGGSYRRATLHSIGRMAEASPDLREATIGRLVTIDVPDSKVADDVCAAVAHVLSSLTREHAARLLERLVAPLRLDEHWIGEVLEWCSNMHPDLVVTFLLARFAEEGRRKAGGDYGYIARPDHLRRHDFTGIRNAPIYRAL